MAEQFNDGISGFKYRYKYKLPDDISGSVLLQWYYVTGNSCTAEGYSSYPFPNSSWYTANLDECETIPHDGVGTPEQFWNCAELYITGGGEGGSPPTAPSTNAPNPSPVTSAPVVAPTNAPPTPTTSKPTRPPSDPSDKTIVGYYASWQYYDRSSLAKPENLDFTKVDRVNFAFFQSDTSGNLFGTDSWGDPIVLFGPFNYNPQAGDPTYCSWDGPNQKKCDYHHYDRGLVSLVHAAGGEIYPSIGGWTLSDSFPAVAASPTARTNFANQCADLAEEYDFDGIDIDWEYPGYSDHSGTPQDKQNFNLLLNEIRSKLDVKGAQTGKYYGLTAALPCGPSHINKIDIPHISGVLDELLLMTYDLHGPWEATTGINAPLYYQGYGSTELSVDACVEAWKTGGAPPSKIGLGLAFYGRSFAYVSGLNQPHQGVDTNNWSMDDGLPQYFSIVDRMPTMTSVRHDQSKTPYAYFNNGGGFVSYDDERSICEKAEYVIDNNLHGFLIWELSGDVMQDLSTPLLDAVNEKLANPSIDCAGGGGGPPTAPSTNAPNPSPITQPPVASPISPPSSPPTPSPTPPPTTSPTKAPVSPPSGGGPPVCPNSFTGLIPSQACRGYYHCVGGILTGDEIMCGYGLLFDVRYNFCNWASQVTCTVSPPSPTPPTSSPTKAPVSPPSGSPSSCPSDFTGLIPVNNCSGFQHCVGGVKTGSELSCPAGTMFDIRYNFCNWASQVTCGSGRRRLRGRRGESEVL